MPNIWKLMEEKKNTFTSKELEVYHLMKTDPYAFRASTATNIAKKYGISQSSITRFCQKLGFSSFSEFRLSFLSNGAIDKINVDFNDVLTNFRNEFIDIFSLFIANLSKDKIEILVESIKKARIVFTVGYGASNQAASLLAFHGMVHGFPFIHIHSSYELEKLRLMTKDDVVILFSVINPTFKDFFSIYEGLPEKKRPKLVLISGTNNHPFSKKVSLNIVLPSWLEVKSNVSVSNLIQIFFVYLLTNYFS